MTTFSGHIQQVRYLIESSEEIDPKVLYRISARMRCNVVIVAKKLLGGSIHSAAMTVDVILVSLATILNRKTTKHLKECKICRTARKKSTSR